MKLFNNPKFVGILKIIGIVIFMISVYATYIGLSYFFSIPL